MTVETCLKWAAYFNAPGDYQDLPKSSFYLERAKRKLEKHTKKYSGKKIEGFKLVDDVQPKPKPKTKEVKSNGKKSKG
jgi:hypothetical protein